MTARVAIIGAGIGGLAAAALLAARGLAVTVVEKAAHPGGKARQIAVDGVAIDAGPTVFTLRDVFEDIFRECGQELTDHVAIRRAGVLARHAWDERGQLDLHADPARSEEAIGDFAGAAAAAGFRSFRAEAARIHGILDAPMLRGSKLAWPPSLMWRIGLWRVGDLLAIRPYESLWRVLGQHFADPRLRQLFARYATYCGSSPFATPATLMLIAHVEAQGVWLIEGGMAALARALMDLARAHGAQFRFGTGAALLETAQGRVSGVVMANGERVAADAVIANADPEALAAGRLGPLAAMGVTSHGARNRSLSALVWLAHARTGGFPLQRHNVLFSPITRASSRISRQAARPAIPASMSARKTATAAPPAAARRARTLADHRQRPGQWRQPRLYRKGEGPMHFGHEPDPAPLRAGAGNGLSPRLADAERVRDLFALDRRSDLWTGLARLGGVLPAPGHADADPGLYCAGGSTHPGAGVPMAALSGRLASQAVMQDLASTRRFHPVAMAGGMSTRSASAGATG
jgi:1-hydroxycarotenoid 3,4-desaturase